MKKYSIAITPADGNSDKYKLIYGYNFSIKNTHIRILKDFEFDGASVPRLLWPIIGHPFSPKMLEPSVEHDFLYRRYAENDELSIYVLNNRKLKHNMRKEVDIFFKQRLIDSGIKKWKAQLMYFGVRTFGWLYYNRCKCKNNGKT